MSDIIDLDGKRDEARKATVGWEEANDCAQSIMILLVAIEQLLEIHRGKLTRASDVTPEGDKAATAAVYLDSARRCLQEAKFPVYKEALRLTWERIKDVDG